MLGSNGSGQRLSSEERFTIVLMTHNRPAFLRRALHYYSAYPCSIMVLDSSDEACVELARLYPNIDYQHLPQFGYWGIQSKLVYGVSRVTTEFMVFAADDDFILFDGITQSLEFLKANSDYGLCHGYGMMYLAHATSVDFYRRDKIVCEDYCSPSAAERVQSYLGQFLPPFYAVTRTDLLRDWYKVLPDGTRFEWQEIGHAYYLLGRAKARLLPIPYSLREVNYGYSEHSTNVLTVLANSDAKSVQEREQFAEFLASLPIGVEGNAAQRRQTALDSFTAMRDGLLGRRSLTLEVIVNSYWRNAFQEPLRQFRPNQYLELPFYNKPFFDLLQDLEFMLHAMPAGRLQLQELEGILVRQHELMRVHPNDNERTIRARLWEALGLNVFNRSVVKRLAESLQGTEEYQEGLKLQVWAERLDSLPGQAGDELLKNLPSGRLLNWLEARNPDAQQLKSIAAHLAEHQGGPRFGILLLDLDADMFKLQATFDSLVNSYCKAFNIVVFTTGDLPATTTARDTVHFVKVSTTNYIDFINQIIGQSAADWLLLAEAGDQFTPSGLLRASLELIGAEGVRAVAMDEIQRKADGSLTDVFRPGVNLDLLQSVPSLMARHWLIRREVLTQTGGFTAQYTQALELDLLLRLIEDEGLAGLAHLAEPLLICNAPSQEENPQERQVLTRHLAARGYRAQVTSAQPLSYQIDYQHAERPLVSIILESRDNFEYIQQALVSVLQRTRYHRHEIVIADNHSQSVELAQWLDSLEGKGERIRILRSDRRLSTSALYNWASTEAKGDYLVMLSAQSQVVNANWLDSLLNQAQRPEVGIVGSKQMDIRGITTQAGLVLKPDGQVASVFVGERKDAKGYLNGHQVEQNYSAVSGVCLMIRKDLFEAVGGLDEEHFAEAFADIDLCLKAADAGYLTVWTPQAQMLHPGTLAEAPQAADALQDKWQARFEHDAARNPNLALTGTGFALGTATAVDWARLLA
ncbi:MULTISPECIES: TIGR00180 family glycosyltransferase [unclassified Pseudomonas]|uniref:TIGR00180 family glycosyltransferase n=1 Tax=unclassified Pseudomonas TaxID=196821 RepID=UPI000871665E|nr:MULTISPECIES: TIGR00180 family glycosyltransferase [unclassified Pseudomonas]SCW96230.1 glycosyltransferase domain-containing protein [Pseudomonas sp. NFACC05-1]SDX19233.1 glycosyltransferase domain-containing protein [Pseudomonas sp. NFACC08-1]SFL87949.1 glycosyltransferase domain-containing protein [Pseudomonas sp. NFACC46-3]